MLAPLIMSFRDFLYCLVPRGSRAIGAWAMDRESVDEHALPPKRLYFNVPCKFDSGRNSIDDEQTDNSNSCLHSHYS